MADRVIKDVGLRPLTEADEADYLRKVQATLGFLERGYGVRVSVHLRGREITHPEAGEHVLHRFAAALGAAAVIATAPHGEGTPVRTVVMVVMPREN
jgi:translation initiation factor IF-3